MGQKASEIDISRLYIPINDEEPQELSLLITGDNTYTLSGNGFEISGKVGELVSENDVSVKIDKINAIPRY